VEVVGNRTPVTKRLGLREKQVRHAGPAPSPAASCPSPSRRPRGPRPHRHRGPRRRAPLSHGACRSPGRQAHVTSRWF